MSQLFLQAVNFVNKEQLKNLILKEKCIDNSFILEQTKLLRIPLSIKYAINNIDGNYLEITIKFKDM